MLFAVHKVKSAMQQLNCTGGVDRRFKNKWARALYTLAAEAARVLALLTLSSDLSNVPSHQASQIQKKKTAHV